MRQLTEKETDMVAWCGLFTAVVLLAAILAGSIVAYQLELMDTELKAMALGYEQVQAGTQLLWKPAADRKDK